jgi:hypothetical protein
LREPVDVEHVIPQWLGNKSTARAIAHRACNVAKGFQMPTEDQLMRYVAAHAPTEIQNYYRKRGLIE